MPAIDYFKESKARRFQVAFIDAAGVEKVVEPVVDGIVAAKWATPPDDPDDPVYVVTELDPATLQPLPAEKARLPVFFSHHVDSEKRHECMAVEAALEATGARVDFCDDHYVDGRPCELWNCDTFYSQDFAVDTSRNLAEQVADHYDRLAAQVREHLTAAGLIGDKAASKVGAV